MADDRLRSALVGPLAGLGLALDDLSIVTAGRRRVVRVAVDRDLRDLAEGDTSSVVPPLSLDEVAEATRLVSDVLDGTHDGSDGSDAGGGDDLMGQAPYTLEVSSPGLDRPLVGHRAFRRNVGRLVALVLEPGDEVTGRLLSVTGSPDGADGAMAVVEVPAAKKRPASTREVRLAEVTSAMVQVEFNRPAAAAAPQAGDPDDDPDDADDDDLDEHDEHDEHEHDELDDDEETDDGH